MFNRDVLLLYRNYVYERANIYYKKEILKLPKPWTNDYILMNFKFTNVNRRLDTGSKFIIDTVCENNELSLEDKVLNCFLYRLINSPIACTETLPHWPILFDRLPSEHEFIRHQDKIDSPVLSSTAYFLSMVKKGAYSEFPNLRGYVGAIVYYVNKYKSDIIDALANANNSPEESINSLRNIPYIGDFLSYQIWVDCTYIPDYHHDDFMYVVSGPGCDQGIDWIVSDSVYTKGKLSSKSNLNYHEFIYKFAKLLPQIMSDFNIDWEPTKFLHFLPKELQHWSLMEIENGFCEFAKYMKLYNNVSMRIRRYNGND